MEKEFTLSNGKAIINFSKKYCDSKRKLLNSEGFKRVITSFVENELKVEEVVIYDKYMEFCNSEEELINSFIESFKLLTLFSVEEIKNSDNRYYKFVEDRDLFAEVIELLFSYWTRIERYTIVHSSQAGEGLQNVRFTRANDSFNDLLLATKRRILNVITGDEEHVYRQSTSGGMAGVTLNEVPWDCPEEYKHLSTVPFINTVLIQPPFLAYTKRNTRSGLFQQKTENPLLKTNMIEGDWFIYPAKVGKMLTFVYFHKDFMVHGINLANLFQLAKEHEYENKKPEIIYIFGYPDGNVEKDTFYFKDTKNDIMIGYANYCDEVDYFGYMKKMLLTLHNIKQIDKGRLPIHGAMVNIVLKNGKQSNIVIMGDSGAGKSESLEAFRTLNQKYIRHMRTIFDDMGYLQKETDGSIKAYGTEIGAFVRVDDLDPAYAYQQLDKGVYINMDKVNARVTIPIASYDIITRGYPVDFFLYANNYDDTGEKKIVISDRVEDAIKVCEDGARRAKGTTSEIGLVKSYFANPFGPVQEKAATEVLVRKYFKDMHESGVQLGEIHTNLAVEGKAHEGPRLAAEELFTLVNK
jgi:hypothetical protein